MQNKKKKGVILQMYDIIIVGAGPAGLFSALEISKQNKDLKVLLIDKGNLVENRQKTEVMNGFGGAGTFSDGKLHFTPVLSHEKLLHLYSLNEYQEYLDYVEKYLLKMVLLLIIIQKICKKLRI